jgi:hypothetical protein
VPRLDSLLVKTSRDLKPHPILDLFTDAQEGELKNEEMLTPMISVATAVRPILALYPILLTTIME